MKARYSLIQALGYYHIWDHDLGKSVSGISTKNKRSAEAVLESLNIRHQHGLRVEERRKVNKRHV